MVPRPRPDVSDQEVKRYVHVYFNPEEIAQFSGWYLWTKVEKLYSYVHDISESKRRRHFTTLAA